MATNFFERQDQSRRQTTRLLVLFGLAVAAIVLIIYFVVVIGLADVEHGRHGVATQPKLWQPLVFLWVSVGTLLVVGLGSLYKMAELTAGGEHIALMLGGRVVDPQTVNLAERRLLNVVEEMALASGIPVPPVYVLVNERGINAFAAGHQPGDAVVAVSAGCLAYLTREELQGVMAHEFSHVLNGDMRLNLRLIGVVHGILVLAIIGYYIMRFTGSLSSGNSKKSGGAAGIFLFGLTLLVLGYVGVFFGKLIKSAISRQREFLADASAVQFTRLPDGIVGALKKIGGLSVGSRIGDGHAEEISHMFFGDAFAGSLFNLFSTHPPLHVRIAALDPSFDGRFPDVRPLVIDAETAKETPQAGLRSRGPMVLPVAAALSAAAAFDARDMVRQIGQPQAEHLRQAGQLVGGMPALLLDAAREPYLAQAIVYILLLSPTDEPTKVRQLQLLQDRLERPLYQNVQQLQVAAESLSAQDRLPLLDLAMPALKRSSPQQYVQLRQTVDALVGADKRMDLFEYCLRTILLSSLDVHFGLMTRPAVRYRTVRAVAQPATLVLSMLAHVGHDEPEAVERAFQSGARKLLGEIVAVPVQQCTLEHFDNALAELAQASPSVKRAIIGGVAACIACDGKVTVKESELLRAVAAVLACPMPPIAATAGES